MEDQNEEGTASDIIYVPLSRSHVVKNGAKIDCDFNALSILLILFLFPLFNSFHSVLNYCMLCDPRQVRQGIWMGFLQGGLADRSASQCRGSEVSLAPRKWEQRLLVVVQPSPDALVRDSKRFNREMGRWEDQRMVKANGKLEKVCRKTQGLRVPERRKLGETMPGDGTADLNESGGSVSQDGIGKLVRKKEFG